MEVIDSSCWSDVSSDMEAEADVPLSNLDTVPVPGPGAGILAGQLQDDVVKVQEREQDVVDVVAVSEVSDDHGSAAGEQQYRDEAPAVSSSDSSDSSNSSNSSDSSSSSGSLNLSSAPIASASAPQVIESEPEPATRNNSGDDVIHSTTSHHSHRHSLHRHLHPHGHQHHQTHIHNEANNVIDHEVHNHARHQHQPHPTHHHLPRKISHRSMYHMMQNTVHTAESHVTSEVEDHPNLSIASASSSSTTENSILLDTVDDECPSLNSADPAMTESQIEELTMAERLGISCVDLLCSDSYRDHTYLEAQLVGKLREKDDHERKLKKAHSKTSPGENNLPKTGGGSPKRKNSQKSLLIPSPRRHHGAARLHIRPSMSLMSDLAASGSSSTSDTELFMTGAGSSEPKTALRTDSVLSKRHHIQVAPEVNAHALSSTSSSACSTPEEPALDLSEQTAIQIVQVTNPKAGDKKHAGSGPGIKVRNLVRRPMSEQDFDNDPRLSNNFELEGYSFIFERATGRPVLQVKAPLQKTGEDIYSLESSFQKLKNHLSRANSLASQKGGERRSIIASGSLGAAGFRAGPGLSPPGTRSPASASAGGSSKLHDSDTSLEGIRRNMASMEAERETLGLQRISLDTGRNSKKSLAASESEFGSLSRLARDPVTAKKVIKQNSMRKVPSDGSLIASCRKTFVSFSSELTEPSLVVDVSDEGFPLKNEVIQTAKVPIETVAKTVSSLVDRAMVKTVGVLQSVSAQVTPILAALEESEYDDSLEVPEESPSAAESVVITEQAGAELEAGDFPRFAATASREDLVRKPILPDHLMSAATISQLRHMDKGAASKCRLTAVVSNDVTPSDESKLQAIPSTGYEANGEHISSMGPQSVDLEEAYAPDSPLSTLNDTPIPFPFQNMPKARKPIPSSVSVSSLEEIRRAQGDLKDTVIFFDWDDTLLPSTQLRLCGAGVGPNGKATLNSVLRRKIEDIERLGIELVDIATHFGTVILVTNSTTAWLHMSLKIFMPRMKLFLESRKIRIVSARKHYMQHFPDSPTRWKVEAFLHELQAVRESQSMIDVIVLGDSMSDLFAGHVACHKIKNSNIKVVKLIDHPSMDQLGNELKFLLRNLAALVELNGSVDVSLEASAETDSSGSGPSSPSILTPGTSPAGC